MRFDGHFWGAALLLLVLVLEVSDRVVMKRDLQIAKEIQTWLLPSHPPSVPGLEIAFATRPANTVAGDYYDVFPRDGGDGHPQTWLIAVADVAGKSIPAALLMATVQASLKTLARTPMSVSELVGKNESVRLHQQPGWQALHHGVHRRVRSADAHPDLRQCRAQSADRASRVRADWSGWSAAAFRWGFSSNPALRLGHRDACNRAIGS